MELVWLIVQATVLCTAFLAVTCSLVWAPWYLLLTMLGIVLVSIRHFMPDLNRAIPQGNGAIAAQSGGVGQFSTLDDQSDSVGNSMPSTPHTTHLIYRGVDYVLSQEREGHPG
jgi:hypothetical protein